MELGCSCVRFTSEQLQSCRIWFPVLLLGRAAESGAADMSHSTTVVVIVVVEAP